MNSLSNHSIYSLTKHRVWAQEFFEVFVRSSAEVGYEEKNCEHLGTTHVNMLMSMLDVFYESCML